MGEKKEKHQRVSTVVEEETERRSTRKRTETVCEGAATEGGARRRIATEVSGNDRKQRIPTDVSYGTRECCGETSTDGNVNETEIPGNTLGEIFTKINSVPITDISQLQEYARSVKTLTGLTGETYKVKKLLDFQGGDSAVLLCTNNNGEQAVAKIFNNAEKGKGNSLQARARVHGFMQTEEGKKYTLPVLDYGIVSVQKGYNNYFEIFPYCTDGDIADDGAFSFEALVPIIKQLNEALHAIHNAGILHRDIKPENLYLRNGRVVFGDFGVAHIAEKHHSTIAVGTDGFRAPETLVAPTARGSVFIFEPAADYYSLGVTLACLYEGKFIYEGKRPEVISEAIYKSHMPLTYRDDHFEEFENLIDGLVQYDAKRRFTYGDVEKWLGNHSYTGDYSEDEKWPKKFGFMEKKYQDAQMFFDALTKDGVSWDKARDLLMGKYFEEFFKSFNPSLAKYAQDMEEKYRTEDPDLGLAYFLKQLYRPGAIVWQGKRWNSLAELAEKMMNTAVPEGYAEILKNKLVTHWLDNTPGIQCDEQTRELVAKIEKTSQEYPCLACYWFGFAFANKRIWHSFVTGKEEQEVASVELLLKLFFGHSATSLFYVPLKSSDGYKPDLDSNGYNQLMSLELGAKFYGVLCSFGYDQRILEAFHMASEYDEYTKMLMLLELLDTICESEGGDPGDLQNFNLYFGPLGIATYVYEIQKAKHIYQAITPVGEGIIQSLETAELPSPGNVAQTRQKMQKLIDAVQQLQSHLQNNPFLAQVGIMGTDIVCTNLQGYFLWRVVGRLAPLGMHERYMLADTRLDEGDK